MSYPNLLIQVGINEWQDQFANHTAVGYVYLIDSKFPYPQFNTTKNIWVYLPRDYFTSSNFYPVVYASDGVTNFDSYFSAAFSEMMIDETMEARYQLGIYCLKIQYVMTGSRH